MKEEEPFYKKTWFIVISAFILLSIYGNFSEKFDQNSQNSSTSDYSTNEYNIQDDAGEKESLEVENLDSYRDEAGILHITGEITNTKSHSLEGLGVEFNLLNAEGNLVGSTLDYVKNVDPGQTWEFEASEISPDNVSSYKVAKVTVHD